MSLSFTEKLTYLRSVQDMAENFFEFSSAVRGFHYYRKYWQPQMDDELYCQHELDNPFDFFAINIYIKNTGVTVGHLPKEISRATNFLLERGAAAFIKLQSANYCLSTCTRGIRNSLSCRNPNVINLKGTLMQI